MKGWHGWLLAWVLAVAGVLAYMAEERRGWEAAARAEGMQAAADSARAKLEAALRNAAQLQGKLADAQLEIIRNRAAAARTASTLSATAQGALRAAADSSVTADSLRRVVTVLVAQITADSIADANLDRSSAQGMTIAQAQIYADSVVKARIAPALATLEASHRAYVAALPKPPSALVTWGARAVIAYGAYKIGQATR